MTFIIDKGSGSGQIYLDKEAKQLSREKNCSCGNSMTEAWVSSKTLHTFPWKGWFFLSKGWFVLCKSIVKRHQWIKKLKKSVIKCSPKKNPLQKCPPLYHIYPTLNGMGQEVAITTSPQQQSSLLSSRQKSYPLFNTLTQGKEKSTNIGVFPLTITHSFHLSVAQKSLMYVGLNKSLWCTRSLEASCPRNLVYDILIVLHITASSNSAWWFLAKIELKLDKERKS